jgi:hypothetical protein
MDPNPLLVYRWGDASVLHIHNVSKMPTLEYSWASSVTLSVLILNFKLNKFNPCDNEVAICIILVLLKAIKCFVL